MIIDDELYTCLHCRHRCLPDGGQRLERLVVWWIAFAVFIGISVGAIGLKAVGGAELREPREDSTFTVYQSVFGTRREVYGRWHSPRVVPIHRFKSLSVVRDYMGCVVEVAVRYIEESQGINKTYRHFDRPSQERAIREFIAWSCLEDTDVTFYRGEETHRAKLSQLLDVRRPITNRAFLTDNSEWRFATIREFVVENEP